eukprot:gnl/TRDRNA2_/TRDRNA2_173967_c0_seq1.p1 gnl/TRDRNA2_/TRDRNA2_173967_c0~~gnl/TRDRNA2_/TRDRNA2_173967_c0_seq1.p1  ORF type:complete len:1033 (-),score=145.04 gnl/TRDRNA2_/TRDRNA2_173967_c0_seq1:213-3311(-)
MVRDAEKRKSKFHSQGKDGHQGHGSKGHSRKTVHRQPTQYKSGDGLGNASSKATKRLGARDPALIRAIFRLANLQKESFCESADELDFRSRKKCRRGGRMLSVARLIRKATHKVLIEKCFAGAASDKLMERQAKQRIIENFTPNISKAVERCDFETFQRALLGIIHSIDVNYGDEDDFFKDVAAQTAGHLNEAVRTCDEVNNLRNEGAKMIEVVKAIQPSLRKVARTLMSAASAKRFVDSSRAEMLELVENSERVLKEAKLLSFAVERSGCELSDQLHEVGLGKEPTCPSRCIMKRTEIPLEGTLCFDCERPIDTETDPDSYLWICDICEDHTVPCHICISCGEDRTNQGSAAKLRTLQPTADWSEEMTKASAAVLMARMCLEEEDPSAIKMAFEAEDDCLELADQYASLMPRQSTQDNSTHEDTAQQHSTRSSLVRKNWLKVKGYSLKQMVEGEGPRDNQGQIDKTRRSFFDKIPHISKLLSPPGSSGDRPVEMVRRLSATGIDTYRRRLSHRSGTPGSTPRSRVSSRRGSAVAPGEDAHEAAATEMISNSKKSLRRSMVVAALISAREEQEVESAMETIKRASLDLTKRTSGCRQHRGSGEVVLDQALGKRGSCLEIRSSLRLSLLDGGADLLPWEGSRESFARWGHDTPTESDEEVDQPAASHRLSYLDQMHRRSLEAVGTVHSAEVSLPWPLEERVRDLGHSLFSPNVLRAGIMHEELTLVLPPVTRRAAEYRPTSSLAPPPRPASFSPRMASTTPTQGKSTAELSSPSPTPSRIKVATPSRTMVLTHRDVARTASHTTVEAIQADRGKGWSHRAEASTSPRHQETPLHDEILPQPPPWGISHLTAAGSSPDRMQAAKHSAAYSKRSSLIAAEHHAAGADAVLPAGSPQFAVAMAKKHSVMCAPGHLIPAVPEASRGSRKTKVWLGDSVGSHGWVRGDDPFAGSLFAHNAQISPLAKEKGILEAELRKDRPSQREASSLVYRKFFLPKASSAQRISNEEEDFINAEQNYRAYVPPKPLTQRRLLMPDC